MPALHARDPSSAGFDEAGRLTICEKHDRLTGSNGFLNGDNPFDYVLPVTMFQLVMYMVASQLLYFLLRPMRIPRFMCRVMGGLLLGPSFLGRNNMFKEQVFPPRQAELLLVGSMLGVTYTVFAISVKMDVVTTLRAAKKTWMFGLLPFLSCFGVLSGILSLGPPEYFSSSNTIKDRIVFSNVLSFSSFPVISDALMELNLITSELGQIALSSSMVNDGIQWIILAIISLRRDQEALCSFYFLACNCGMIFFCFFVIRPVVTKIAAKTPTGKPVKEVYIVSILLGVPIMAGVADMLGISLIQGPWLFGLIMPSGPPLGTTLTDRTEAIISSFLQPFFHLYIGLSTNLCTIHNWRLLVSFQCIIFVAYIVKLVACVVVARMYNIRLRHGIVLGLILNIKGIIDLIAFSRLKNIKVLDEPIFSQLVLSTVGLTAIITPLIKILYQHNTRLEPSAHGRMVRTIQNTPRNSEFRIVCCVYNESNVHSTIALLESCNPSQTSPIGVYVIHLIEILGKSTPVLVRFDKHGRKSLSVNYPNTSHIMRAFENYSSNSSGPVTILPYIHVAPYKTMHESICNLCEDNLIPFLIIPFHENHQTQGTHLVSSVRDVNTHFQAHAPCTVGILVDKGLELNVRSSESSFHVGIFFIGGADDREALALGFRMAERKNSKVSVFHIILQQQKDKFYADKDGRSDYSQEQVEEEAIEKMIDQGLIDEFKGMNIGNDNVVLREIMVEDGVEALDSIRETEGNYDLVMMGRRHNIGFLRDEEITNLIENAETLGMYGDMLASTEFCNGMVSVLVIQSAQSKSSGGHKREKSIIEKWNPF
ncbi:hypothetical protein L6164_030131 [Bauhinia variegata]|uniref:Uncharacterized protein n=1 Tax=Bauhinia variegata TaxID=167791 RepID=A0ACB9LC94_BAUVA|nr:hypothetical protein L6164_030131 [Bauhinia variegata]